MSTCRSGRTIRRSREGFCNGSVQELSFGLISWLRSTVVLIIIFLCKTFSCIQGLRIMALLTLTSQMRPLRGSYIQEKQKSFGIFPLCSTFSECVKKNSRAFLITVSLVLESECCWFGWGTFLIHMPGYLSVSVRCWSFLFSSCLYMCAILTWGYSLTTVLVSTAMFFITAGLTCTHFPPRVVS